MEDPNVSPTFEHLFWPVEEDKTRKKRAPKHKDVQWPMAINGSPMKKFYLEEDKRKEKEKQVKEERKLEREKKRKER